MSYNNSTNCQLFYPSRSPVRQFTQHKSPSRGSSPPFAYLQENRVPPLQMRNVNNFLQSSHQKLESTLANVEEKLQRVLADNAKLKGELEEKSSGGLEERERLMRKVEILIEENEKSTNLVQVLARQEEEMRGQLQESVRVLEQKEEQLRFLEGERNWLEKDREDKLEEARSKVGYVSWGLP